VDQSIIVSDLSFANTADPFDILSSNNGFVHALLRGYLRREEISHASLLLYDIGAYIGEVNNGGFSQFVLNTRWSDTIYKNIEEGLIAIGADRHLSLFLDSLSRAKKLDRQRLAAFLKDGYSMEPEVEKGEIIDALNLNDSAFYDLEKTPDANLTTLAAAWLRRHPMLKVMSKEAMKAEVARRITALPDLVQRKQKALDDEPDYMKHMRALSKTAGHSFLYATAGVPTFKFNGHTVLAWFFFTDKGRFYMIEEAGKAMMFSVATKELVATIDAN